MILQAVVGGFVLDALFGDPAWLPHPVVLMPLLPKDHHQYLHFLLSQ